MSDEKAVAAFMSGLGTAMPIAWLIGNEYGDPSLYAVVAIAVVLLFTSHKLDMEHNAND